MAFIIISLSYWVNVWTKKFPNYWMWRAGSLFLPPCSIDTTPCEYILGDIWNISCTMTFQTQYRNQSMQLRMLFAKFMKLLWGTSITQQLSSILSKYRHFFDFNCPPSSSSRNCSGRRRCTFPTCGKLECYGEYKMFRQQGHWKEV